tara:strand:+ start:460 stop:729 length:270 start_codon:yes stop_codon:yes gene_type:complete
LKSKLKPLGAKFDGKSRVSNETYRNNWDKIFKKNLEGSVINIEESFTSKDFYEEAEREKQELEESYKESRRQTEERKNFSAKAIDGYGE